MTSAPVSLPDALGRPRAARGRGALLRRHGRLLRRAAGRSRSRCPGWPPLTIATLPASPKIHQRRKPRQQRPALRRKTRSSTCFGIAELVPIGEQSLVAEQRVVGREHDPLGESSRDLALQFVGEVFRRPAVQLAPDIGLVQQHRDHLALPWPGRPRRDNRQLGKTGGDRIEMARVTGIESDAVAAAAARRRARSCRQRSALARSPRCTDDRTAPRLGRSPAVRPNRRRRARQNPRHVRGSGGIRRARRLPARAGNAPNYR